MAQAAWGEQGDRYLKFSPILLLVLLLALVLQAATAMKVKADMGETWIRWSWDDNTTVSIYVDGLHIANSSIPYYYLSGAKANSEHRLELRNATTNSTGELLSRSTIRTLPQAGTIQLLLGICFVFTLVVLFSQDGTKTTLSGLTGIVIASYGRSLSYNYYGMDWVFSAFIVAMVYLVGRVVLDWARENLKWK